MYCFKCVCSQFRHFTVFNWQPVQVYQNRRNVIKMRGIEDEPCGSVLNPLQFVSITGW